MATTALMTSPTASSVPKKRNNDGRTAGIVLAVTFAVGMILLSLIAIFCLLHKFKKYLLFHLNFTNENTNLCTSQRSEVPMDTYGNPLYGTD